MDEHLSSRLDHVNGVRQYGGESPRSGAGNERRHESVLILRKNVKETVRMASRTGEGNTHSQKVRSLDRLVRAPVDGREGCIAKESRREACIQPPPASQMHDLSEEV